MRSRTRLLAAGSRLEEEIIRKVVHVREEVAGGVSRLAPDNSWLWGKLNTSLLRGIRSQPRRSAADEECTFDWPPRTRKSIAGTRAAHPRGLLAVCTAN
eukprot:1335619-Pleurochrysis_carterae.AAC.5